jgi:hypothetical protein
MRRLPALLTVAGLFLAALAWTLSAPLTGGVAFADDNPKPSDPVPPGTPVPPPGMDEPGMDAPAPEPGMDDPGMKDADPNAKDQPVALSEATNELKRLETYLGNKKSDNGDIVASMEALIKAHKSLKPDGDPPADPAAAAAAKAAFETEHEKFQSEVEKLLLKAMALQRINPKTKSNERDDVNVKAVTLLGQTRPEVTDNMIKIFEAKREYDPPTAYYDETMKSIALLNDHKKGLAWIQENWLKHKNNSSAHEPEIVNAAFAAVPLFKDVDGKTRLAIVKETMTLFVSSESQAQQNKTKEQKAEKEYWDEIKVSVIKALQVLSKEPKDEKGALLATMKAFDTWFRAHDKPHDPAWTDPKPAK